MWQATSQNLQKQPTNTPNDDAICPVCGEKNSFKTVKTPFFGSRRLKIKCRCDRERDEADEQLRLIREKNAQIDALKINCGIGKRYENSVFDCLATQKNNGFDKALSDCKNYCKNYDEMAKKGIGIYLYGSVGTGKTHLAACVANELMSNCQHVIFTDLFEISRDVRATFNRGSEENEQSVLKRFASAKFLVLDDIGSEIFAKKDEETWIQGLLFDLINRRYNELKPTIFTSNYSLKELIETRGISEKTVSRITEMCRNFVLKISGKSRR